MLTQSWRSKSAVFRMHCPLTFNGYSNSIKAVKRQRNLGLTFGLTNLRTNEPSDQWTFGLTPRNLFDTLFLYLIIVIFVTMGLSTYFLVWKEKIANRCTKDLWTMIKIWGVQVWWMRYVAVLMKFWASLGRCSGIDRDERWPLDSPKVHYSESSLVRRSLVRRFISPKVR